MTDKKNQLDTAIELRRQAEEKLRQEDSLVPESFLRLSPEKISQKLHELRVHQIELEMQNEELRRTQDELGDSRARYFDIYDLAPVGYFTISETGLILEANLTAATLLCKARNELVKWPVSNFILKEDQDIYFLHRKQLFKTGEPQTCELRMVRPEESPFWARLDCTVAQDNDGSLTCRVVIVDITERKQAEKNLKMSEEKYRTMLESMKDSVYICSSELCIEYMNPAMIDRVGRDATGEICHKSIYNENKKCSWCVFDQIEKKEHVEYEVIDPKDNRYYSVSSSPISHSDGTVSKLTMFRDITQIKITEENLRQSQKMESIGTLTGGIAHDFNNLLYMIVGNTELALEDIPKWNPAYTNLEEIKSASLRAAGIVKQLLNFSRKTDEKLIPIDAVIVIKDSLKFLRSTIPTTVEIHEQLPDNNIIILADSTQINQIMMNLCINASQAMEETGGILKVSIEKTICEAEDVKELPDLVPGNYLKITVNDTGPGISPEIINQIFDPYFTTKEIGKGSGLGLSIVHGIIKNHGGAIWVDSSLGKGTTFTFLFPMVEEKSVNETETETIDKIPRGHETILFVDDEKSITKMTRRMLERLGYRVETSLNPIEALDLFQSKPEYFDLVITDMTMPQMTGTKLSEKLIKIRSDIPVIICTGHSSLIDEETTKRIGVAGYVMKPASMSTIAKAIRKVLDK